MLPPSSGCFRLTAAHGRRSRLYDDYSYAYASYIGRIGQQRYQQALESARAALGDVAFAAAFAAGKALPLAQSVAEALAMPIAGVAAGGAESDLSAARS